jgi:glutamine amidotransferase
MCRWFAYISPTEPCLLEDVLITPVHAISKQVHDHYLPHLFSHLPGEHTTKTEISLRNRLFNVDGFGLVWYTSARSEFVVGVDGPRPVSYKCASPPGNDANFHSICAGTSTLAAFSHIRAATGSSVTPINNHPFVFGRHTIMHNGLISHFPQVKRQILDITEVNAYENIHGTTDSEHLAALYITNLTRRSPGVEAWEKTYPLEAMLSALTDAFHQIIRIQQSVLGASNVQACSLNVCVTDGQQLVSVRLRNHSVENPPSLYFSTTAGVTLNRKFPDHPDANAGHANPNTDPTINPNASEAELKKPREHGKHVIIASEPTTYKIEEWNVVEKNHGVMVDRDGNAKVVKIDMPQELMAQALTGKHF